MPGATKSLRQLLSKYEQQSNTAASFLFSQKTPSSFIPLPARVVAQNLLPLEDIIDVSMIKYYYEKVHMSSDQIIPLEQITRGQSSCNQWHEARRIRISGI